MNIKISDTMGGQFLALWKMCLSPKALKAHADAPSTDFSSGALHKHFWARGSSQERMRSLCKFPLLLSSCSGATLRETTALLVSVFLCVPQKYFLSFWSKDHLFLHLYSTCCWGWSQRCGSKALSQNKTITKQMRRGPCSGTFIFILYFSYLKCSREN